MGKKKKSAKRAAAAASRGVVGPDYMQVLSGTLASKSVTLVLCGESHHDAIDVTRSGGGKVKEGWSGTDLVELTGVMVGKSGGIEDDDDGGTGAVRVRSGICKTNKKLLPLGKACEWGRNTGEAEIEYIEHGHEMVLLWVPSNGNGGQKGRTFLVELFLDEVEDEERSRSNSPPEVMDLLESMSNAAQNMRGVKSLSKAVQDMKNGAIPGFANGTSHTLQSWSDMDEEARQINHRRLLGEDISTLEYDELICDRKKRRQKNENIWSWDDWLLEVKSKLPGVNGTANDPALHVVLESSVPPWEVELCRGLMPDFEPSAAADCIRCLSEDSDESDVDAFDPASDGFGSYMDHVYRRLLGIERAALAKDTDSNNRFLHCVDCRDLGCEHACVDDSLHEDWMGLLGQEERETLLGSGPDVVDRTQRKDRRCLPHWGHSPEQTELDRLRNSGELKSIDLHDQESEGEDDEKTEIITFPSMESFFGQCTDIMYYTPNFKTAFGPFLGKCVQSHDKWRDFFAELFLGGEICRALHFLDLSSDKRPFLHVRSPILKFWNAALGEYEWHEREDDEDGLTLPQFPARTFLKARGSDPARTWSSNIFASLLEGDCDEMKNLALHARQWSLDDIARHCDNPKHSDDEIGGGEWFLAYLRQCHREIYDDIDHSDAAMLLRKQYAVGDTKKHKIGEISIPNCRAGFQMINDELSCLGHQSKNMTLSREAEVMAKILIDIYMSKLIDATTVVKIAQIISQETKRNVIIVCYMGSVHTRAVCDFFCQSNYGFKRKIFAGKQDWDDEEGRILHLPAELWNVNTLFKK